jgi:hypothetical protein
VNPYAFFLTLLFFAAFNLWCGYLIGRAGERLERELDR